MLTPVAVQIGGALPTAVAAVLPLVGRLAGPGRKSCSPRSTRPCPCCR
ncbi:hypothetical protein ABZ816_00705 [Actinosynnema sp. NPDC047251]|nr:hypothetical protein [Saccharothrix espanaensis]